MTAELRFTRSRQAVGFALAALVAFTIAASWSVTVIGMGPGAGASQWVRGWWVPALAALAGAGCAWMAIHLVRQPMIILTSIGIEVYPFFRPAARSQSIFWAEVESIACDRRWLRIVLGTAANAGIFVSLAPVSNRSRELLVLAVGGISEKLAAARARGDGARDDSDHT